MSDIKLTERDSGEDSRGSTPDSSLLVQLDPGVPAIPINNQRVPLVQVDLFARSDDALAGSAVEQELNVTVNDGDNHEVTV